MTGYPLEQLLYSESVRDGHFVALTDPLARHASLYPGPVIAGAATE
jgi:hypothetical protein